METITKPQSITTPVIYLIKELEGENRRLKKMYADLSLQHDITKEALTKKF